MTVTAYIGLGSNLGDSANILRAATAALAALPLSSLRACAPWYRSAAVGPGVQPDYLNTVVAVATRLEPMPLLRQLQAIEQRFGRTRHARWAPRTLDLDLLLYAEIVTEGADLTLPHPRLSERNFVLYPLADIAPTLVLPNGTPLTQLLANTSSAGIVRVFAGDSETDDG